MSRILIPANNWFDELALISYYGETIYERKLLTYIETVFPDYYAIKFKKSIKPDGGGKARTPDLALIRKDYSEWWIIEVELATHNFEHIEKQITVFTSGIYEPYEISKYIKTQKNELDLENLKKMIINEQPKVMVVVDQPEPKWQEKLSEYNVKLCVFEVFKDKDTNEIYRLHGEYPYVYEADTHCKFHKTIPNMLIIHNPEPLDIEEKTEIEIYYKNKLTKWVKIIDSGTIYLKIVGPPQIDEIGDYVIYIDTQKKLHLKHN